MKVLIYVGMVILTIYLGIMYRWPEGAWLLSGEIVFPFLCLGMAWSSGRKVRVRIESHKDTVERGEEIPVRLSIVNEGKFPAIVKIKISHRYIFGNEKKNYEETIYVPPHKSEGRNLCINAEYCGKLMIATRKLRLYDWWGFTSVHKKCKESCEITVMPKPYPVNLVVSNRTKWFPIDGESYAKDRGGDDTAEIYEVREYRFGDRMQKVHWKLSAKEDELYIKEFSYPLGAAVILLLEGRNEREEMENFTEVVVSVSAALLRVECPHYIVWQKKQEKQIRRVLIREEEDFHEFLMELLQFDRNSLEVNTEEYYRHAYKSDTYSTLLRISTDLTIRINKEESMHIESQNLEEFFETVEIVV